VLQIFCETGFKVTRYARVMHDQIDLFIQSEGSVVVLPTVASIPSMTMVLACMRAGWYS